MVDLSSRKPERDLGFVILFFIVLGVLWYAQGGYKKIPQSPLLNVEQTTTGSFEISEGGSVSGGGTSGTGVKTKDGIEITSEYGDKVFLYIREARKTVAKEEYIEIKASGSNKNPINISSWTLVGKENLTIPIPRGVEIFESGKENTEKDIILYPGDKAIVSTGKSPLGKSFKINKCTGYFSSTQTFYPSISKNCPNPKDESWLNEVSHNCSDYVKTLSRCNIPTSLPPFGGNCILYINKFLNYNGCVEAHKNDNNFFKNEWRVFLNRSNHLWHPDHDTIILRDGAGKVVDSINY